MFTQRQSCDRCRQQKVRCLKDWRSQSSVTNGDPLAPCERCEKANAPCVYSLRQKSRRASNRHKGNSDSDIHFSDDLTAMLSRTGGSDTFLSDLSTAMLHDIPDFNDSNFHGWDSNNNNQSVSALSMNPAVSRNDLITHGDCDGRVEKTLDTGSVLPREEDSSSVNDMISQLVGVSTRASRATRDLERLGDSCPSLTVNSPAVHDAFEAANSLVHIINSIPPVNATPTSIQPPSPPGDYEPPTADYGLIFMTFASHQHVLALFKAICGFIRRSIESKGPSNEQDRQMFCGNEASSAQFVMVLQLVMHMINRIGRSFRIKNQNSIDVSVHSQTKTSHPNELTLGFEEGKENGDSLGIVDAAQDMLRALPDDHIKLKQNIQVLQTSIEELLHV